MEAWAKGLANSAMLEDLACSHGHKQESTKQQNMYSIESKLIKTKLLFDITIETKIKPKL